MSAPVWQAGRWRIPLEAPVVMGIVNVTPDSFSDGGRHATIDAVLAHARSLVEDGAAILDFGAESTRPGAQAVSPAAEWQRLEPVLREVRTWSVPVSIDTRRTEVMARALDLGADIINDVQGLKSPGALALLAAHSNAGVVLMHMRGEPATMQQDTDYGADVVRSVAHWLADRGRTVQAAGVAADRIVLDPGIGFAKTPEQNLALLQRQAELRGAGYPLLAGWSRKSTLGLITGREPAQRVAASVAAALLAVQAGAAVVRVHDVAPTVDALKVLQAVRRGAIESK